MSRMAPVIKREFVEFVRTKAFVIGTVLGPVLMLALLAVPALLLRGGGSGERSVAIVDVADTGVGEAVAAQLASVSELVEEGERARTYRTEVLTGIDRPGEELREELLARVEEEELHGVLWLPEGVLTGEEAAVYEGRNATNLMDMSQLRSILSQSVQQRRLAHTEIDPAELAAVLRPVRFEQRKSGERTASGSAESAFFLGQILSMLVYFMVLIYGQAVLRGVLEEKRDRIVEIVVSSIRSRDLMFGKVIGIGVAGLVQMGVWVAFAVFALLFGSEIAGRFGMALPEMPSVPAMVWVTFMIFFLGGYFLYAALFAALGSLATTDQEGQQIIMPVMMLLVFSFFGMFAVINDPDGMLAVVGSIVPISSPILMPIRTAMAAVPPLEYAAAVAALAGTSLFVLWLGGKIYRIGILTTGKRPTFVEVARWLKSA